MASTCKSMGLMVMLMLAVLVASAQAEDQTVTMQNGLEKTPIKCNGKEVKPGHEEPIVVIKGVVIVEVLGKDGKWVPGHCDVPKDVAKVLVFLKVDGIVAAKVVVVLGGLIHQLLGTLVGLILVLIKVNIWI